MDIHALLAALFPLGHTVTVDGPFISGTARTRIAPTVEVVGTANAVAVDAALSLRIAGRILAVLEGPPRPFVFLVDTSGQALRRHEELIGLNGYLAHVASCVDVARRSGFASLSIVYGEAVSGGYLSLGLMADRAYALGNAQIRVMDLAAMARVTRLPLQQIEQLAKDSPVFAPGAANYARMGAVQAMWPEASSERLEAALGEILLASSPRTDDRIALGHERGGRMLAEPTAAAVARAT